MAFHFSTILEPPPRFRGMDGSAATAYRSKPMRLDRLRTATIALVAAYAVALQGLLAAFAIPAGAGFHPAVLCSEASIDRPDAPASHEPSCATACAMLGAAAAPAPPDVGLAAPFVRAAPEPVPAAQPAIALRRSPHIARAPPSA